jgi:hypothetical protein
MKNTLIRTGMLLFLLLVTVPAVLAAFGEDVEKPRPEFTREGAAIMARLIPRAKSTSVSIRFEAKGGNMAEVSPLDFEAAARPEVYQKDFRCDLFTMTLEKVPVGGEAVLSVTSDFFTSSTGFWLFNPRMTPAWKDMGAKHAILADRVQVLTMTVRDGGPFDNDGAVDGKIVLIGGPRDSFWGYAIGTLFIRFFGVFMVLTVLMAGMLLCGSIFAAADKHKTSLSGDFPPVGVSETVQSSATVSQNGLEPGVIAAIALALHMEMSGSAATEETLSEGSEQSAWRLYGRQKIMSDRLQVFKRHSHS